MDVAFFLILAMRNSRADEILLGSKVFRSISRIPERENNRNGCSTCDSLFYSHFLISVSGPGLLLLSYGAYS
jgi:hypothetical protein